MVDQDIIIEKTAIIQRCLKRISEVTQLLPGSLDDINIQDIYVLNLQRAVQASIDLAAHIIADEGLGLPGSLREHFTLLAQNKIITEALCKNMIAMVGFRNIAVHEYQKLDEEILKSILQHNLQDFETYYREILIKFKI